MTQRVLANYDELRTIWRDQTKSIIQEKGFENLTHNKTNSLYRISLIPRPQANVETDSFSITQRREVKIGSREFWVVVRGVYLLPEHFQLIAPPDEFHGPILIKYGDIARKSVVDYCQFYKGIEEIQEKYKGINLFNMKSNLNQRSFLEELLEHFNSSIKS